MNHPPPAPALAPIPIPWSRRLRLARETLVPAAVLVLVWTLVAVFWREEVSPLSIVGEVEIIKADITALEAGTLTNLAVAPFQRVQAGDLVAVVNRSDPARLTASVAVIRAELALLQANLDPVVTRQRAELDYERLRIDLANQRLDQARDQIQLEQARLDLARADRLATQGIISSAEHEQARVAHALLQSVITDRQAQIEARSTRLATLVLPGGETATRQQGIDAAAAVQERRIEELVATLGPLPLVAPIDGLVGRITRRPGEGVLAGEIITTITAETGDRILAYLRPPIRQEVSAGMSVLVRTRGGERRHAPSFVEAVDPHFSLLPETLLTTPARQPERALVFAVSLPTALALRPGELVDLDLRPGPAR